MNLGTKAKWILRGFAATWRGERGPRLARNLAAIAAGLALLLTAGCAVQQPVVWVRPDASPLLERVDLAQCQAAADQSTPPAGSAHFRIRHHQGLAEALDIAGDVGLAIARANAVDQAAAACMQALGYAAATPGAPAVLAAAPMPPPPPPRYQRYQSVPMVPCGGEDHPCATRTIFWLPAGTSPLAAY